MHLQTLFVTTALTTVLSGMLLLLACKRRGIDPLAWWGLAMILGSAGLLLRIAPLPPLLTLDVAKMLLVLTGPVSWTAARSFVHVRPAPWRALAGVVLWLVLCRIPEFRASEPAQLAASCAIGSAYVFATAYALHPVRAEALPSSLPALILLYFHAALYAGRAMLAATGLDRGQDDLIAVVMLVETHLHTIGMAVVLILMTKERAERGLERSLAHARAAGDSRARFVAHMSHEVRTPLNGILGVAQLLKRDPRLQADQRRNVELLEAAGQHLLAITNDALDLARIDAGRLEITAAPLSPREVVEDCLALVGPAAAEKQLTMECDVADSVPTFVCGDITRLRQILLNLAWNAVKFTPIGGSVVLRARLREGLCFEVADTGPGIPEDKQAQLFQEFSQLKLQESGTGLGLSLSARLAARMGGSLSYRPAGPERGSVFHLMLPWPAIEAPVVGSLDSAGEKPEPTHPLAERLHLLVVDDVKVNRHLLRATLALDQHTVEEAHSGVEALSMIERTGFDAVLMDVRMPDLDGLEVTRRVRAMAGNRARVPIIGVSADAMPEVADACRIAGMDAVLAKPIERGALRNVLTEVT